MINSLSEKVFDTSWLFIEIYFGEHGTSDGNPLNFWAGFGFRILKRIRPKKKRIPDSDSGSIFKGFLKIF